MIKYVDQLKTYKFKFKPGYSGGKRVKKCLDILTFDIEVTSAWKVDGRLKHYEPGYPAEYWNDKERYALPWIWQFGVNDTVYYGRDIKDFLNVLNDLPRDMDFIIFIHNLAYEFGAALCNIMTFTDVFARAPHKPMKCTSEEYPNIEFRCTYILTGLSLDQWGKEIGFKKLTGDLDYNLMRTPLTPVFDYEMDYCEYDCLVVYHGILEHLKIYKDVWDLPLTNTGKVRRRAKKLLTNDKAYMKGVKRLIPKDAKEYYILRHIFAGGYTHGNRKYVGKVVKDVKLNHLDIASFYPSTICSCKFPYNKWAYMGKRLPDPELFEYYAFILKLHFVNIQATTWNTYISASRTHGSGYIYDNGRVLAAKELYITCTEQDFITICRIYKWDQIDCEGVYMSKKKYLPAVLIDFVLDLYEAKTNFKDIPDKITEYNTAKVHINSMFGMMVTAIFNSDVIFNQDAPDPWTIGFLSEDIVNDGLDKLRVWFNTKYFLSYSVGCWITAICRRRLFDAILSIDADCIYCDTDSLFYIGDHDFTWFNKQSDKMLKDMCNARGIDFEKTRPVDKWGVLHPLGHLETDRPKGVSKDATFKAFKTLGAKKYIEQWDDKLYMTVAGINKGAVSTLKSIDDFADGFIFDKDNPDVHKLEHCYINNMPPITWPDGYYSDLKYGINMRPTGYKLSIPNVYDRMEDFLNGNITISDNYDIKRRGLFNIAEKIL